LECGAAVSKREGNALKMASSPPWEQATGLLESRFDDDARLVQECLRGKEAAWSELVSKYKNLIFSIPVKQGFSQEEAADVFQSVCLDLVNQLTKLREPRALAGCEKEQLLRNALRTLSDRCRRLVEMLFFETPPRPYGEIAKSLTLATGSIGFIRARCLDRLRKKMEEIGFT
jgi:DNA-directed RNA polymerase specialized sigma24 family protein